MSRARSVSLQFILDNLSTCGMVLTGWLRPEELDLRLQRKS